MPKKNSRVRKLRAYLDKTKSVRIKLGRYFLFFLVGFIALMLLVFVRAETIPTLESHPFVFIYGVLIFMFLAGRIITSFFYRSSLKAVLNVKDINDYEPSITFVIPCKNEEDAIAETIETCFMAEYPAEKVQVIAINDGSTDGTGRIMRALAKKYPNLVMIDWKENRGKREAMAEGFRLASGEIVIQLDSDSTIEPSTVRHIVEPFANPVIGAVCGHADVANADENYITKMQAVYYYVSFRVMKAAESVFYMVFCCSGCSSAYRKSAVMPILDQWLNEMFLGKKVTYGDDRSLTTWILKAGWRSIYTDRVRAYTIAPNNIKQLFNQQLRWKKSWIINGIFTIPFLVRREPFTAFFYFIPLVVLSLLTPFVGLWNVYLGPIIFRNTPVFYLAGIVLTALILVLYYRILREDARHWPYLFLWQFINTFFFSYVILYAIVRIQDRGWGTR